MSQRSELISHLMSLGDSYLSCAPRLLLTGRRLDIVLKYRMFLSLNSDFPEPAQRDYINHIWARNGARMTLGLPTDGGKRSLFDYIADAVALHASMDLRGFDPSHPIPVDEEGDILGGAHRIACALALGKNVIVCRSKNRAWAPEWDAGWFLREGFDPDWVNFQLNGMRSLIDGGPANSRRYEGRGGFAREAS